MPNEKSSTETHEYAKTVSGTMYTNTIIEKNSHEPGCPDCGATLQHVSGCLLCVFCGWSACP